MKKYKIKKASLNSLNLIKLSDYLWWAFRDSNPGPTGYEPGALTN
jgi:hypothetical protein